MDSGNNFFANNSTDSSTPWFLRVQELAHDSLIAATRAQLAKNAKASNNGKMLFLLLPLQRYRLKQFKILSTEQLLMFIFLLIFLCKTLLKITFIANITFL